MSPYTSTISCIREFKMPRFRPHIVLLALLLLGFASVLPAAAEAPALGDQVLGDPNAPVTIIEYASMTCPHCAAFENETFPQLKTSYIDTGKAKLIFRDFPLDEVAVKAAMLARCSGPGRYYGFIQVLFQQQRVWAIAPDPIQALAQLAKLGGVSQNDFSACMQNKSIEEAVLNSRLVGQSKFDVNSTPTFIINGTKHSGAMSFEELQKMLDPLLPAKAAAATPAATPPTQPTAVPAAPAAPQAADAGSSNMLAKIAIGAAVLVVIVGGGIWFGRRKSG